jgi:hypothetical protein
MAFADTPNKAAIRRLWDLPLLEQWHMRLSRGMTYFGLTGPEMHDLLDWKHLIDYKTTVESLGRTKKQRREADETIGRLMTNMMLHGISSGFQILRGDIEDVIINAVDTDGRVPQMNDGRPAHLSRFSYDIVNLDFDGGLGYRNRQGAAKRTTAIKKIFERQMGHSFVMLLTINIRDTLGNEIDGYLRDLRSRDRGTGWKDLIDWYLCRPDGEREYKLKAMVPSFIHAIAEPQMFRSMCRPPIVYDGHERARMMHFAFELESQQGNLRSFSQQDDRDLIELPLIRCRDSQFMIVPTPGNNQTSVSMSAFLDFLPETTRKTILGTVPLPLVTRGT